MKTSKTLLCFNCKIILNKIKVGLIPKRINSNQYYKPKIKVSKNLIYIL